MAAPPALSAAEAAVYDRQIRLWGVHAQARLTAARVLVAGISNVVAEACKNLVLAGVGSVTLLDDRPASADNSVGNFLVPIEAAAADAPPSLAEACVGTLRDFNPMVSVSSTPGAIERIPSDFLDSFDAVLLGRASLDTQVHVNALCRSRPKPLAFFAVDLRGDSGLFFMDLNNHTYFKKGEISGEVAFPSLKDVLAVSWKNLPKRTPAVYFAMQVILLYEARDKQGLSPVTLDDMPALCKFRDEHCRRQELPPSRVADGALQAILTAGGKELPAVSAIMGGVLGQEIIKCLSGIREPFRSYFVFDMASGEGSVVTCLPPSSQAESTV